MVAHLVERMAGLLIAQKDDLLAVKMDTSKVFGTAEAKVLKMAEQWECK
jgi:hypothetical protein